MGEGWLSADERDALERAWGRFLDEVEPYRPDLYRYCRRLTGSVWAAEDLAQDTALRAFAAIGRKDEQRDYATTPADVWNPKAYLFRIATNLWADTWRRGRPEAVQVAPAPAEQARPDARLETGDAVERLIVRTSPQERAALLLKDVFDFTLEEIADMLTTSVGAVKAALHRARTSMAEPDAPARSGGPSRELVDRFVEAFNARDVPALTALLLETSTIEVVGSGGERGRAVNWIPYSFTGYNDDRTDWHWAERCVVDGETIVVHLHETNGERVMESITRLCGQDGRIVRIRDYCYCPQTLQAAAAELGLPLVTHGYRFRP